MEKVREDAELPSCPEDPQHSRGCGSAPAGPVGVSPALCLRGTHIRALEVRPPLFSGGVRSADLFNTEFGRRSLLSALFSSK